MKLGSRNNGAFFKGALDNLIIYEKVLNQAQIDSLYTAAAPPCRIDTLFVHDTVTIRDTVTINDTIFVVKDTSVSTDMINEITTQTKLLIYPNPFKDIINIGVKNLPGDMRIVLNDVTGQRMLERLIKTHESTVALNVSHLPPGNYFITVFYNQKSTTVKILKE